MKAAGWETLPMQNQILTMGQWGWVLAHQNLNKAEMKGFIQNELRQSSLKKIDTRWLTPDAFEHVTSFGKPLKDTSQIKVNTLTDPILPQYYNKGNWDLY